MTGCAAGALCRRKDHEPHNAVAAAWNAGSDEVRMRFLQDAITWLSPRQFVEFARFFDFQREGRQCGHSEPRTYGSR